MTIIRRRRKYVRETDWSCSSCGTMNKGRVMICKNCSNPKESDETYQPAADRESQPEITDPELLRLAYAGPHLKCPYCQSDVRNIDIHCPSCGSNLGKYQTDNIPESESDTHHKETIEVGGVKTNNQDRQDYDLPRQLATHEVEMAQYQPTKILPQTNWPRYLLIVGLPVILIATFVWLMIFLFAKYDENAIVINISWWRTSAIDQRFVESDENWDDNMPAGAFNVDCDSQQRGTEDCNPHGCDPFPCNPEPCNCKWVKTNKCTDLETGFEECDEEEQCEECFTDTCYKTCYDQCPVYDDWCSYDYHVWREIQRETTRGNDHNEYWHDLQPNGELQRMTQTSGYEVNFSVNEKEYSYEPEDSVDFARFNIGEPWQIRVNRVGSVEPVTRLMSEEP
ncbi:hypothetical protein COT97_05860 [Candidatus Falkowbacteria bacterium CG10_big_fil_rev_8_21_14_0_10_39_11]|uniref:RanBP2-type domain-containing protein n=1 Tax=Candidatus Falkowbacteria bacterium CG10_big_fil_rev_8_21_14_0_10_39_11 TaxID=1974565 RepID=A0A2H0V399_9BACT|nr:MAG: hypothetical protein COT97_05860 [Candidatus Falkowbacteria bacterium CG10_big_fil_rev_8_21_14_0_10_39_11]